MGAWTTHPEATATPGGPPAGGGGRLIGGGVPQGRVSGPRQRTKVVFFLSGGSSNEHAWPGGLSLVLGRRSVETLLETHFLKTVRRLLQNERFSV